MNRTVFVALAASVVVCPAALHAEETKVRLERALLEQAPKVLQFLKETYQPRDDRPPLNVGVLKFAVQKGDGPASDNVGPLNLTLAHRLETALLLTLKDKDGIGLLERPSTVVAVETKRADHQWPSGRKALFDLRKFRLAWGADENSQNLAADVFLTGTARLSPDLRTMEVTIRAFDRKDSTADTLPVVTTFRAAVDSRTLIETGESFLVARDLVVKRKTVPTSATDVEPYVESRSDILEKKSVHPGTIGDSPVTMEIFYGDEKKPVRATADGRAEVDEPANKTRVTFRLHNTSKTDTYGVVLMVNGINTLFEEELPPEDCHKWILDPGESVVVEGFQQTLEKRKKFDVEPVDQAVRRFRYGDYVGTFQMIVFLRDVGPKPETPPEPSEDEQREQGVAQAMAIKQNDDRPESLEGRQQAILTQGKTAKISVGDKGLIVSGAAEEGNVKKVDFRFYRDPVMSSVIYYYRPKAK